MRIDERVRTLSLPLDQVVVIGSGVLDALGLRMAGDVDLVLSAELFAGLTQHPDWQVRTKHNELLLTHNDTEAFLSWGSDGRPNFQELYSQGVTIDGVRYAHPRMVMSQKQQRGNEKDMRDIALLKGYLNEHSQ